MSESHNFMLVVFGEQGGGTCARVGNRNFHNLYAKFSASYTTLFRSVLFNTYTYFLLIDHAWGMSVLSSSNSIVFLPSQIK